MINNSEQILAGDIRQLLVIKSEELLRRGEPRFVEGLDEIAGMLGRYDPAPSPLLNALDHKAQDMATYFFVAYSNTRDLDRSILIYRTVKSLVRYVLLIDRFYEVGNKKYERVARGVLRSVKKVQSSHLKYSLDFLLKRSWPFMDYEQAVKRLLIKDHIFNFKEIRHYSLFKASDAPMIYAHVLDAELPDFNQNVAAVLHYNQALQDLHDDFEDIEEDVHDMMPNMFILAATGAAAITFSKLLKNREHARKMVIESGALDSMVPLVEQYRAMVKGISVPPSFAFLKYLTKEYADMMLRALDVSAR
ncbi:MAG: hypothetical protein QXX64_02335 [Nitrososphaera sp.]|uniref:Uncharacterized protein n=1 Tax=Nitrososphaera gargensis (strain Ga9.2) TaxID=1237085 RepID=K0INH9_NITGG|nr:hypothetical protein [Candidatus Nitrososphaera gargensis]AFU59404.1 hypothetical protein Ngar_c24820 [Candidatus Nitrososphaera gargensis Ga9.2]